LPKRIVLVDDDLNIIRLVRAALEKNGYQVTPFLDGETALASLDGLKPSAMILDLVLPGLEGLDVLRQVRARPHLAHLPVIILTSRDSEVETVLGLEMGADDYMAKPIRYHELLARLKKLLARPSAQSFRTPESIRIHDLEIDRSACQAKVNGQNLVLTYLEFQLLALLAKNPGQVFSRDQLLNLLWHEDQHYETRTVDVHVRRLRKKMADHGIDPLVIETVRQVGYRMSEAGQTT